MSTDLITINNNDDDDDYFTLRNGMRVILIIGKAEVKTLRRSAGSVLVILLSILEQK